MGDQTVIGEGDIELLTVEKNDIQFFRDLRMTEGVEEEMGFRYPKNTEQTEEMFEKSLKSEEKILLLVSYRGRKAGQTGAHLDLKDGNASMWIFIHPDFQGEGVGTETTELLLRYLFDNFPINRVEASYAEGNKGSENMQESIGFKKGSIRKEYLYHRGEYRNLVTTSILREEWES